MKFLLQIAFLASLFCNSASAGGTHGEGHGQEMEIGKPANKHINRSVTVKMFETEYGMVFKPNFLKFEPGQTVKINLINKGELQHEFVMDTEAGIRKHRIEMENMPDMDHNDPNSLRLNPNEKGEILWTFSNSGVFEFACLIPGHYEAGMHGKLSVTD
jgi:uncharacterized cupredoxin-like copper-binding protein